jgi:hypothetical protein
MGSWDCSTVHHTFVENMGSCSLEKGVCSKEQRAAKGTTTPLRDSAYLVAMPCNAMVRDSPGFVNRHGEILFCASFFGVFVNYATLPSL